MKKIIVVLVLILLFVPKVHAADLLENASNGILVDSSTGEILFEKNVNERVSVASLTKMMVQIIVLENIESGKIKWSDIVVASSNASGMGGTQIWLSTGEKMSVEDLFKGMSIVSANDATVALAEYISGTEGNFVKLMNEKAKELNLKNTNFVNCTGLDEEGHYSSAYDLSVIARELLKHDEILRFSSSYEDYIRTDTPNKYWLVNTNKLIRFYEGVDGLKTGFTDAAKYTMTVTAKRNDLRLIAVVLGEEDSKTRNNETMELLNYGFDNYKIDVLKRKGEVVDSVSIDKGTSDKFDVVVAQDLSVLSKKIDKDVAYDYNIILNDVKLPIKSGDVVGKLDLIKDNKVIKSVDLLSSVNVDKISYVKYIINKLLSVF